jgi:hypothetical protein
MYAAGFYSRTISTCSVACLENVDTCSAFRLINETCFMGAANAPVRIPDEAINSHSIQIWKDEAVSYGTSNKTIF